MIVVVVGPTASGKSALAVELASRLSRTGRPAEIVNADSMLVYRGMDIGTAKPTVAERGGVVHHLLDVYDVRETVTVADFQTRARAAVRDCLTRGVVPVLVGGSALYVRAVVDDFVFPGTDEVVRARLEAELAAVGAAALHTRLAVVAPAAAAGIEPGNGRRVVRALEVFELTGAVTPGLPAHEYALPGVLQLGLAVDRSELDRRIEDRVDRMWAAGLVEEVRRLAAQGLREGRTASRALGYRQVLQALDGAGQTVAWPAAEAAARQQTKASTRRFARKQAGWFDRDPRIHWLTAPAPDLPERALEVVGAFVGDAGADEVRATLTR